MRIFVSVAERKGSEKWDVLNGPDSDFVAQDKALDKLIANKGVMESGKGKTTQKVEYAKAVIAEIGKGARRRRSF